MMKALDPLYIRSHGKLMISGEYLVLSGAKALALPVKFGQSLTAVPHALDKAGNETACIIWKANQNRKEWFHAELRITSRRQFSIVSSSHPDMARKLKQVLEVACQLNPNYLTEPICWHVTTEMDFDREWGLGSSSTLISNLAWWADVDPYQLLFHTFGGSGYDIACARSKGPLVYHYRGTESPPEVEAVDFHPPFKDQLFFVYTGRKQSSAESLRSFAPERVPPILTEKISRLTYEMLYAKSLDAFQKIMKDHEHITAQATGRIPIQQKSFADFDGTVKSLGAWGGDFLMAASTKGVAAVRNYFHDHDCDPVVPYDEMVLNPNHAYPEVPG